MQRYVGAVVALVVVAAIGLGMLAVLGSSSAPLPQLKTANAAPAAAFASMPHASLTLETFPFDPYSDPDWIAKNVTGKSLDGETYPSTIGDNPGWVKYWPTTSLVLPAHALVTIKIMNFDSATTLLNNFYAQPQGTVDAATGQQNVMLVNGPGGTSGKALNNQLLATQDPTAVSHTFTIHSIPNANQPWLYVSVPITGVNVCDPSQPNVQPPDCANADDAGMPDTPVVTEFSFMTGDPGQYIWQCFDPCGANYNGFGGPMATRGYMSGTLTVQ
jgi:hypothetical protein